MLLEVCVDSAESAILAEKGGAKRIELCSVLELGGLTPSVGLLQEVKKHVRIPVFCMIRCRSGDFFYNSYEISTMVSDAQELSKHGADGFVFGFLDHNKALDINSCELLIKSLSKDYPCTLHRAFDFITNVSGTLRTVRQIGFSRILTTGGGPDVSSSFDELKMLLTQSEEVGITILPGGGVNESNVAILKEMGFKEVHSSCSVYSYDGDYGTLFNNPLPNGKRKIVCLDKVETLCKKLNAV